MILYHGTTATARRFIAEHGLVPRGGTGRNNWKHTVGSNPKAVYLSRCYALHFAYSAAKNGEAAAIFEVDRDYLDPTKLQADEDAVEQSNRGRDGLPESWDMKRRTIHYRTRAHLYSADDSLRVLGTCGFRGTIRPGALRRVAILTSDCAARFIIQACDPCIMPLNYRIMGAQHTTFHEWLFDPDTSPGFERLSREGLTIEEAAL